MPIPPKCASFYSLGPALGKRAAMVLLRDTAAAEAHSIFAWGCFRDFVFRPAVHREKS
jgi:hypothetical protein